MCAGLLNLDEINETNHCVKIHDLCVWRALVGEFNLSLTIKLFCKLRVRYQIILEDKASNIIMSEIDVDCLNLVRNVAKVCRDVCGRLVVDDGSLWLYSENRKQFGLSSIVIS